MKRDPLPHSRFFLASGLVWTTVLVTVGVQDHQLMDQEVMAMAETSARHRVQQDLVYREWAARQGGVYAPVSEELSANPHLRGLVEEQTIMTPKGVELTLVNPAYMTRQVYEMARGNGIAQAHITSLRPIREENGPDPWERDALVAFETGADMYSTALETDSGRVFRYMIPMVTEEGCLHCHGDQGYELGDIRGGLSVDVDLEPLYASQAEARRNVPAALAGIWVLGIMGLGLGWRSHRGHMMETYRREEELRASQHELVQAQRIGRVGSYRLNVDAGTWHCSETLGEMLGVDCGSDHRVEDWATRVHPDDRSALVRYLSEVVGNTAPGTPAPHFDRNYRLVDPDTGEDRWVRGLGVVEWSASGEPVRMMGTVQDIHQEYLADQSIRLERRRLEGVVSILEGGSGAASEVSEAFVRAAAELTGSEHTFLMFRDAVAGDAGTAFEVLHRTPPDVMDGGRQDPTTAEELFRSGDVEACVGDLRRRFGREHVRRIPLRNEGGDTAFLVLAASHRQFTARDANQVRHLATAFWHVVARRRAVQAQRDSEDRFQRFAENAVDVLFRVEFSPGLLLSYASPSLTEVTGYELAELEGRPDALVPLLHPDDRDVSLVQLAKGTPTVVRILDRDGETVHLEVRCRIMKRGETRYMEGVARDVTERVVAERTRERLEDELQHARKLETVGQLAGGVAHDFNNMLGVIIGHAELMLQEVTEDDPLSEDIQSMLSAAHRSTDLTRQLLTFARQQKARPRQLDLNAVLPSMVSLLRRVVPEYVSLEWEALPTPVPVMLDPVQLDQVVTNLVMNARDAMSGDGRVLISLARSDLSKGFCRSRKGLKPGAYARVTVRDNGPGMPRSVAERIFEPFFTTKAPGEGTGLGLASVYGIVRQNDGWIDLDTAPGMGTRFTIYLPLADAAAVDSHEPGERESPPPDEEASGTTVLVVEDQPELLGVVSRVLGKTGYRVVTATSAGEARDVATNESGGVDILVTDVVLPESDGPTLADTLVRAGLVQHVLYMSGYAEGVLAHHGLTSGDLNLLRKPFTQSELVAAVTDLRGRSTPTGV